MYTVAGVCGDGCGCKGSTLAGWPSPSAPLTFNSGPSINGGYGYSLSPYAISPFSLAPMPQPGIAVTSNFATPLDYRSNQSWYDGILSAAGDFLKDLGADALSAVKQWIQQRIGQEAWERSPEDVKRAYVQQALASMGQNVGGVLSNPVMVGVLGFGAAALLLRRKGGR